MIEFSADTVRVTLHLLGVAVWVGGQIVMAALLRVLRTFGTDAPRLSARAFATVAWPAYVVLVFTGMWGMLVMDTSQTTTGYQAVLGIKLILVALSGAAAFIHSTSDAKVVKAATGGGGLVASLGAVICGVLLVNG